MNLDCGTDYPDRGILHFPAVAPGKLLGNTLKQAMTTSSQIHLSSLLSLYTKYTSLYVILVQIKHDFRVQYALDQLSMLSYIRQDSFGTIHVVHVHVDEERLCL